METLNPRPVEWVGGLVLVILPAMGICSFIFSNIIKGCGKKLGKARRAF